MSQGIRWTVLDRSGNSIYLTQERWEHIIEPINHPEMEAYEEELKATIQKGFRKQDPVNPQKYRYTQEFNNLPRCDCRIQITGTGGRRDRIP